MDADLARYDDVVHAIYDAALKPASWPAAIGAVADLCCASSALLFTWAHAPANGGFAFPHNISQQALELWAAKSMHEDPFVTAASRRNLMIEGAVLMGDELVLLTQVASAVPEPATYVLLLTGFGAIGITRRRKRVVAAR